jgi:aminoglycoside phosphotransferase (APT) family kinase protein
MAEPSRLIASGRDGDIFEYGPALVLRRTKTRRSLDGEARVLEYVAAHAFPVPAVHELRVDGTELIMERVEGPLLVEMAAKPWTSAQAMRMLADLHDRLHAIAAPEWLPPFAMANPSGAGRVLHLDLHPQNVIVSPKRGPVVIDWTNAHSGDPFCDLALTYALMMCGRMPGPRWLSRLVQPLRSFVVGRPFVARYDRAGLWPRIAEMAELIALDTNMHPDEVRALRRLAASTRRNASPTDA